MNRLKLNIQRFADGKVVIDTQLNTKDFENGLDKIKKTSSSAGASIKNIVAGLGITKLISSAIGEITSSLDGATKRFDTLNNYPKVMNNLGIASEDAEASIDKMSEKLAGLPTTLDQGASAVQRFTSSNGDISKSTDLFLALNNAIIAGGQSSEIQASALEQLSQAYAKGKPDMMEWRSAMTAMPAQLKQVAEAMGYVDADALGEALRNGTVSMDEFMDEIVKLNTQGIGDLASFEEQARTATGGIGTSITVAKTQVVKGVTDIIDALNVKLEELGIGKINDIIANIGKGAKNGLDIIAKLIKGEMSVKEVIDLASNLIINFVNKINENLPSIIKKGGEIISSFLNGIIKNAPKIIQTGMQMISTLIIGISQQLPTLIPQAIQVILTIVESLIDNIDLLIDAAIELVIGLTTGIIDALPILIDKVPIIIEKLVTKLTDPKMLNKIFNAGITLIVKLALALVQAIPKLLVSVTKIGNSILNGLKNIMDSTFEIGINIVRGIWSGISGSLSWIKSRLTGWVGNVTKFLKRLFGIHSPSTLMRDEIGKYMAQGIGVGFDDELNDVYKNMQKTLDFETSKLSANVQSSGTYQVAMTGVPQFNLLDNSENITRLEVNGKVLAEVVNTENRNREVATA